MFIITNHVIITVVARACASMSRHFVRMYLAQSMYLFGDPMPAQVPYEKNRKKKVSAAVASSAVFSGGFV